MEGTKMIKKDAQINITVGVGFLQKLHELMVSIISVRTEEEIQTLKSITDQGVTEFPEQWMEDFMTVTTLVKAIEQAADTQGFVYMSSTSQS